MARKRRSRIVEDDDEDENEPAVASNNEDEEEEEDDEEDLDEFEDDGFLVDDDDEEEEEESEEEQQSYKNKQKKKRKRKRKSLRSLMLDDDDLELIRENENLGKLQSEKGGAKFKRLKKAGVDTELEGPSGISDDDGPLFSDVAEEDEYASDDEQDEMANFIVDHGKFYGKGAPISSTYKSLSGQRNSNQKSRHASKASSAVGEASYTFSNADEVLNLHEEVLAESARPDNSDDFAPFILKDKYMTEKDASVKETDVPERMQIFGEIIGPAPVDEMSIIEESSWILGQLGTYMYPLFCKMPEQAEGFDLCKRIREEEIMSFLKLHHLEKCDIPFITMYRKEQCLSLLKDPEQDEESRGKVDAERTPKLKWHKVLWAIKELDKKWLHLQKRKSALQRYYNKRYEEECCNIVSGARLAFIKELFETTIKSLKKAESERDIDDVDMEFSLHFPPTEGGNCGKYKRPAKKSQYSYCNKAGLWELAHKFGDSKQFGFQITLERTGFKFDEDPEEFPEEIASNFMCEMFETPEAVLKGARHMAAVDISCETLFRKHARSIFMDRALVSTSPTPKGNKEIDCFHQYAGVKWLHNKPLSKFEDMQWLLIQKAEEEKLLETTIKLPESALDELISASRDVYLRDNDNRSAQIWNEQRKIILEDAIKNFLLPSMEKEARALLTTRAKNWLLIEYGKQFWNRVSVAPYHSKENVVNENKGIAPRVMACCWGPGKPETTFVMLDSSGEVLDVLHAGSITKRSQNVIHQQQRKNDQQHVLKFMKNYRPHVIVLGAANVACTRLKDDIKEIIFKMVEENTGDISQVMNEISIVYGDESFAHIYEHSQISSEQLPGQPGIVKRAVALGRYLQNPLVMIATLCGAKREIVSWKLSSLDHYLTGDEKWEMIEWVMVDVTNQVGLDLNLAASHAWLFAPLQFVSGLGPRKAASLQSHLLGGKEIRNRRDLISCGLRGKNDFYNAVGFLRVCCSGLHYTGKDTNLLDNTRIHPESYSLAEDLAKAVHKFHIQEDENNADSLEEPVQYIHDNPQLLKSFDITDYSEKYEIEIGENRRETLSDIKMELLHGFQDPRRPYEEPTQDEEFDMVSRKNGNALAEGRIVQATVRNLQSHRAFCVLDSGLTGVLVEEDFSDNADDISLAEKLHVGDILTCKIKQVEKDKFQVCLTCKESELKSNGDQNSSEADPYYRGGQSSLRSQQGKAHNGELAKKPFNPRMIVHPHFQNLTLNQAVEFLSNKDAGECIFRPSARGPSYLTLTLKICDGLFVHKDITEGGKDHSNITSLLRLGKTLKIGDDYFKDIDEVVDRYVDPLVTHLKTMVSFRKFKRGSKAEVDKVLRVEKSEYPTRIVYCFGVSYEHPGTFILSYIKTTHLRHEFVGLHPKGFKFRKQMFGKIEQLVAYFQKHIDDLQHESAPMQKSAFGGSSVKTSDWGSNDSGWQSQPKSGLDKSTPLPRDTKDYGDDVGDGGQGLGHGFGCGRGRGRGRGRNDSSHENKDSGYDTYSKLDFGSKNGDEGDGGWSTFHSEKVQNSPSRWDSDCTNTNRGNWGGVGDGTGSWSGGARDNNNKTFFGELGSGGTDGVGGKSWGPSGGTGGWGDSTSSKGGGAGGATWGGSKGAESNSGGNQGGNNGCGHGSASENKNNTFFGELGSGGTDGVGGTSWGPSGGTGGWGGSSKGGGAGGWGDSSKGGGASGVIWGDSKGVDSNSSGNQGVNNGCGHGDVSENNNNTFCGELGSGGTSWGPSGSTGGWGDSSKGGGVGGVTWGGSKGSESNTGGNQGGNNGWSHGGSDGGWCNSPDAKIKNSPGKWDNDRTNASGGNWGGGGDGTGGWSGGGSASFGNWDNNGEGGHTSNYKMGRSNDHGYGRGKGRGPNRGRDRGQGRGRGCDSYNMGDEDNSHSGGTTTGGWSGGGSASFDNWNNNGEGGHTSNYNMGCSNDHGYGQGRGRGPNRGRGRGEGYGRGRGQGRGRGRGRDSYNSGDDDNNHTSFSGLGSGRTDSAGGTSWEPSGGTGGWGDSSKGRGAGGGSWEHSSSTGGWGDSSKGRGAGGGSWECSGSTGGWGDSSKGRGAGGGTWGGSWGAESNSGSSNGHGRGSGGDWSRNASSGW